LKYPYFQRIRHKELRHEASITTEWHTGSIQTKKNSLASHDLVQQQSYSQNSTTNSDITVGATFLTLNVIEQDENIQCRETVKE
jgi:hypothetical protein